MSLRRGGKRPDRRAPGFIRHRTRRHPVAVMLSLLLIPTLLVYSVVIALRLAFPIALVFELLALLVAPIVVSAWIGGRAEIKSVYAGLMRWRIGVLGWLLILTAMPVLAVAVAAVTGSLRHPQAGWWHALLMYLVVLVAGALSGNLWEETAWAGFVQSRLMDRHGLLKGSMLTAVPFTVIHLPLAFQNGLRETPVQDVFITWLLLIALAPCMRYVMGSVMLGTGGSVLAVGFLHASMNATMALPVYDSFWQFPSALAVLTGIVALRRALGGRTASPSAGVS